MVRIYSGIGDGRGSEAHAGRCILLDSNARLEPGEGQAFAMLSYGSARTVLHELGLLEHFIGVPIATNSL